MAVSSRAAGHGAGRTRAARASRLRNRKQRQQHSWQPWAAEKAIATEAPEKRPKKKAQRRSPRWRCPRGREIPFFSLLLGWDQFQPAVFTCGWTIPGRRHRRSGTEMAARRTAGRSARKRASNRQPENGGPKTEAQNGAGRKQQAPFSFPYQGSSPVGDESQSGGIAAVEHQQRRTASRRQHRTGKKPAPRANQKPLCGGEKKTVNHSNGFEVAREAASDCGSRGPRVRRGWYCGGFPPRDSGAEVKHRHGCSFS